MPPLLLTPLLAALLGGPPLHPAAAQAGRREPHAMEKKLQSRDFRFQDPAKRLRYDALSAWISGHSPGFRHVPLRVLGNFLQERWCGPGVPESACEGGAVANGTTRGTAWRTLEVLHYPDRWPQVFGIVLSVGEIPREGPAGVRLYLSDGGGTVTGDGLSLAFLRLDAEGITESLPAGDRYALDFPDRQTVGIDAPGGWQAELARLAASPRALEQTLLARLEALEARIALALEQGELHGFDEGPYEGRGIPPLRTIRPLTAAERDRLRADAGAEIARRRAFIRSRAGLMHASLGRLPVAALLGRP